MNTITLTEEQARANMQLLDLAVKAGGLNAAAMALPIAQSLEQQLVALQTPPTGPTGPTNPS